MEVYLLTSEILALCLQDDSMSKCHQEKRIGVGWGGVGGTGSSVGLTLTISGTAA